MKETVPTKADEYLARAIECEIMAQTSEDPESKKSFLESAKHWRDLAKQAGMAPR
jgi:hypothetical protein